MAGAGGVWLGRANSSVVRQTQAHTQPDSGHTETHKLFCLGKLRLTDMSKIMSNKIGLDTKFYFGYERKMDMMGLFFTKQYGVNILFNFRYII